ncbi:hypothetical protein [Alteribacter aurantiacus]|uniref:hypothetical protein n=1 Tax=Alteribacter aurantiacus TaxID=254410 RepID=UPI00040BDCD0|nr:hypothetical protein [Alteribacter aurantiacus]
MATYIWKPLLVVLFYTFTRKHFIQNGWTVKNFSEKWVPYNFGMVLLLWITLEMIHPGLTVISIVDYGFLFCLWLIGWLDDRFGQAYPKGIKGHLYYCLSRYTLTTGLVKAVGGVVLAASYLLLLHRQGTVTQLEALFYMPLLILMPHVFNLLDTRPLRVMKVAMVVILVVLLVLGSLPVLSGLIVLFVLWFKEEGHEKTMLGDNGAVLIGGYLVVTMVHAGSDLLVFIFSLICVGVTFLAERYSISKLIEEIKMLNRIDLFGRKKSPL